MTDHQGHILLSPEAKVVLLPKAGHYFFGPSQQIESSSRTTSNGFSFISVITQTKPRSHRLLSVERHVSHLFEPCFLILFSLIQAKPIHFFI